jgi:hypothetical protein
LYQVTVVLSGTSVTTTTPVNLNSTAVFYSLLENDAKSDVLIGSGAGTFTEISFIKPIANVVLLTYTATIVGGLTMDLIVTQLPSTILTMEARDKRGNNKTLAQKYMQEMEKLSNLMDRISVLESEYIVPEAKWPETPVPSAPQSPKKSSFSSSSSSSSSLKKY